MDTVEVDPNLLTSVQTERQRDTNKILNISNDLSLAELPPLFIGHSYHKEETACQSSQFQNMNKISKQDSSVQSTSHSTVVLEYAKQNNAFQFSMWSNT